MAAVLREQHWTAAEWARRAGVTPTNLTRFLRDPDGGSLPGAGTIGRLAWAAGSEPRFLADVPEATVWRVPLLSMAQLQAMLALARSRVHDFLRSALRDGAACVLIDRPASPRAFALRITSHHLNAGGVIHHDRIVLEPADVAPPRAGDLVAVLAGESVCAYRFYPPYLMPISTNAECVPILCDGAALIGVGVHVVRPLRA